jgi:hypothetical protein
VALAVLCVAAFTINLDTTIVNIALPSSVRQLDASTRELQWVVDAYTLTFAALVLAAGSLSDRYGRKGAPRTWPDDHARRRTRSRHRGAPTDGIDHGGGILDLTLDSNVDARDRPRELVAVLTIAVYSDFR